MTTSKLGRLLLALSMGLNGLPALLASAPTPTDRPTVLTAWADALGVRGSRAASDAIAALDYSGTGTIAFNGEPCQLTTYRVRLDYTLPGMRREFNCSTADGQAHHEIQIVTDQAAWNETAAGLEGMARCERSARCRRVF